MTLQTGDYIGLGIILVIFLIGAYELINDKLKQGKNK